MPTAVVHPQRTVYPLLCRVRNLTHVQPREGQNFGNKKLPSVEAKQVFRRSMCSGALRRRVSASMGRVTHKRSTPHSSPLNNKHVFTVKPHRMRVECAHY